MTASFSQCRAIIEFAAVRARYIPAPRLISGIKVSIAYMIPAIIAVPMSRYIATLIHLGTLLSARQAKTCVIMSTGKNAAASRTAVLSVVATATIAQSPAAWMSTGL